MKYLLLLLTCFAQVTAGPKITNITPPSSLNNARIDTSRAITITLESAATVDHINFGETTIVTAFTQPTGNTIHIAPGALPPSAPGTVTVTITYSDTSTSPANHPFDYYTYQGNWLTYVPDQNTGAIYVFDFANPTNLLIDTLLPPTAINNSFMAVITPDGKYAYCTSNSSSFFTTVPYLTIINTVDQSTTIKSFTDIGVVHKPNLALKTLANSPDGNVLVVVGSPNDPIAGPAQAYKIDVTNRTTPTAATSSTYDLGTPSSFGVSFTPDSSDKAYVVNETGNISIINLLDGPSTSNPSTYMDTTLSGAQPVWLAPFPVGVSSSTFFDLVLGISPVVLLYEDPLVAGSPQDPTNVPGAYSFGSQIVASPDSKFAYVPNAGSGTDNNISIIDLAPSILMQTGVITPPAGFAIQLGIAIDPDGKNGIVSGSEITTNGILRFSTTSPTAQTSIDLGNIFSGGYSATTPDQSPVAYATYSVSGQTVSFNGSGSLTPTLPPAGHIASWFWDFGDGNHSTMVSPTHTYALPGSYTVTLTVTNTVGTSTGQTYFGQMMYNNGGPQARTQFQVSVSSNLLPPSMATITQQKKICPIRNTLTIYPPLSGPQPTNYLVYTSPNKRGLVANVPATTGPVQVTVKARCQATCYYIFSQDNSGISSTYLQKCIK